MFGAEAIAQIAWRLRVLQEFSFHDSNEPGLISMPRAMIRARDALTGISAGRSKALIFIFLKLMLYAVLCIAYLKNRHSMNAYSRTQLCCANSPYSTKPYCLRAE